VVKKKIKKKKAKKKKLPKITVVQFGGFDYIWPYYLNSEKVEKIKELSKKYLDKANKLASKHNLKIFISCEKTKSQEFTHYFKCSEICKNKCGKFLSDIHICKTLNCPKALGEECIGISDELKIKRCKKYNLLKEKKKIKVVFDKYVLLYKISRGFKIDPLRTLKYLKKKSKKEKENKNGKIQYKENKKGLKVKKKIKRLPNKKSSKIKKTSKN
jgi:hypothetical protein